MKRNYWGKAEEELCNKWLNTTNDNELTLIYKALHPKLYLMGSAIIMRYFSVPFDQHRELINDAISEVFLRLKTGYRHEQAKSFYAFCGAVIKHYFYDTVVVAGGDRRRAVNGNTLSIDRTIDDEYRTTSDGITIELEDNSVNLQEEYDQLKEAIISLLLKHRDNAVNGNIITYCDLAIKYINEFTAEFKLSEMVEYIWNNSNITNHTISNISRQIWGYYTHPATCQKQREKRKKKDRDGDWNEVFTDFIQTDYVPNIYDNMRDKMKKNKNLNQ